MENITNLSQLLNILFIIKIIAVVVTFLYMVFTFIVVTQVRSLNKIVFIKSRNSSLIVLILAFLYLGVAVSLFLGSLVIL